MSETKTITIPAEAHAVHLSPREIAIIIYGLDFVAVAGGDKINDECEVLRKKLRPGIEIDGSARWSFAPLVFVRGQHL